MFLFGQDYFSINNIKYNFEINKHSNDYGEYGYLWWGGQTRNWGKSIVNEKQYSVFNYNYSWYNITTYQFKTKDINLNGNINLGMNFNDVINILGEPDFTNEYAPLGRRLHYSITYGELYYDSPYSTVSKLALFFDDNNKLVELHYNIIEKQLTGDSIDENISLFILNEWKTYPTHYPQWVLIFNEDNTFLLRYKYNTDDDYQIITANWELLLINGTPNINISNMKNYLLNGYYPIYKRYEDYYFIFNGDSYYYPERNY